MPDLTKIISNQAVYGEKIENIEKTCEEIKTCLIGNGKTGLVVRTDRLEQKDKLKTQLFWIVAVAVVALVVETVGIDLVTAIAKAVGGP